MEKRSHFNNWTLQILWNTTCFSWISTVLHHFKQRVYAMGKPLKVEEKKLFVFVIDCCVSVYDGPCLALSEAIYDNSYPS